MCNPRRIEVTASRQVAEAWVREVHRVATQTEVVTGAARVLQPLDASVGAPALAALEQVLQAGLAGWTAVAGGYRHELDGGYVTYLADERALEIVATACAQVQGQGRSSAALSGQLQEELTATAEADYYDDGWGGWTQEHAHEQARRAAEARVLEAQTKRIEEQAQAAVAAQEGRLRAAAQQAAATDLAARAEQRRAELAREAAARLQTLGVHARQAFHGLLAQAYRQALLALARRRGAQNIICSDGADYLEIEFLLPR